MVAKQWDMPGEVIAGLLLSFSGAWVLRPSLGSASDDEWLLRFARFLLDFGFLTVSDVLTFALDWLEVNCAEASSFLCRDSELLRFFDDTDVSPGATFDAKVPLSPEASPNVESAFEPTLTVKRIAGLPPRS